MRYNFAVLLLMVVLSACNKHAPPTSAKQTAAGTTTVKKNTSAAAANNASNSSDSSVDMADEPVPVSETESPAEGVESSSSQSLALRALQSPAAPVSAWKEGVHYKVLSPVQPTSALPGQVEVAEAFWYGSAPCYVLDQSMEVWRKQKASYVNYVRLPVMWGSTQRLQARMFYIAELLGKSDELHSAIFQELHVRKAPLNTLDQVQAFFTARGVSIEDFKRANSSSAIEASLKHAQILGDRYRITVVPTIIVNGRYVTDAVMAGGQAQLLVLINELAAREKED